MDKEILDILKKLDNKVEIVTHSNWAGVAKLKTIK